MNPQARSLIRGLLLRAVQGELSLEALYANWPEEAEHDPFAEVIYDDIESAVEHFPLGQERLLRIDLSLLDAEGSSEDLLRARKALLRRKDEASAEEVRRLVSSSFQSC